MLELGKEGDENYQQLDIRSTVIETQKYGLFEDYVGGYILAKKPYSLGESEYFQGDDREYVEEEVDKMIEVLSEEIFDEFASNYI